MIVKIHHPTRFSLRLTLVVAVWSVIAIAACQPAPPVVVRVEWQHPSPAMDGATLDEFMVTPLAADGDGGVWFGYKNLYGDGGVGHLAPGATGGEQWEFHPVRSDGNGPGSGFVLALLPDDQSGVWVGSLRGGLSHYDGHANAWQTVALSTRNVMAITADSESLWLATFGSGIVRYDHGSRTWTAYTRASTAGGLQDDQAVELIPDGRGGLWAGTHGGGISHYDPVRDTWQAFTVASTSGGLGNDDVRALAIGPAGGLWVGTFGGGISHYDPRRDVWELYAAETTAGGLASDHVLTLLPRKDGELWAGLSNLDDQGGLAYFDGKTWQSYTVASTDGGLLSDDVRALAPDGAGGVWVGTRGGGLSHLAADRQTWTTFTAESTGGDLAGDTVLALLSEGDSGLWVGTASGLSFVSWVAP